MPDGFADSQAAPLLCAGLIGYRALRHGGRRASGSGSTASAPPRTSSPGRALREGRARLRVHARRATTEAQAFARSLGAEWAGGSDERRRRSSTRRSSSRPSARSFPRRSRALREGRHGRLRRDPHERHPRVPVRAAVGRARRALGREPDAGDGVRFLELAPRVPVRTKVSVFPLERTHAALDALRAGELEGAAVVSVAAGP